TEPMQCECCFKSPVGRHFVISGQLIDPAAGTPALNQPQGLSSLRISSTVAQLWSSRRHCALKGNLSMNEALYAQARFGRSVLQAFLLERGACGSVVRANQE